MFSGIVETLGKVTTLETDNGNLDITIESDFTQELKIDQSVAHNGCCLTVVKIDGNQYTVTAIQETLDKTNIGSLKVEDAVNLERCLSANGRFDGHVVQGHVDQTAECINVEKLEGSYNFTFKYRPSINEVVVEKGSICVNGISLTAHSVTDDTFTVSIIPYTFEHTNIQHIKAGSTVNLEFDIIGKYVARLMKLQA